MNVQQLKQTKITLFAAIALFALALLVSLAAPKLAFAANDASGNEAGDGETYKVLVASGNDSGKMSSTEGKSDADENASDAKGDKSADKQEESDKGKSDGGTQAGNGTQADGGAQAGNGTQAGNSSTDSNKGGAEEAQPAGTNADANADTNTDANADTKKDQSSAKAQATYKVQYTSMGNVGLSYNTHVQNIGWQSSVKAGQTAGTSGRSLRLEGIHISLAGLGNRTGSIHYQTHVQNVGWQAAVKDGQMSGTQGRALRLEGIKIWLSGDVANHFDVYYRTHVQNIGWQGWVKNGALAGTTGRSLRLEAIQIILSAKTEEAAGRGASTVGVRYDSHVQNVGWQFWTGDGGTAGTSGRSLRVEALNIVLSPGSTTGGIEYNAHVQNIGWQGWKKNGQTTGTSGRSLRVEALQIKLTGEIAKNYNVYYRTHVQNYGWLDWASNGGESGSHGLALRLEAVQIVVRPKTQGAPGSTKYTTANSLRRELNGIDISSHQAGINLYNVPADFVIVKVTGGTRYVNPEWRRQAEATLASGKMLGLYHFAREASCPGSAYNEAMHFYNTIKSAHPEYIGQAVLFLDFEADAIYQGTGWAKSWLDTVRSQTGGVKPLIYMSKYYTRYYNWSSVASTYKLWVAQYPNYDYTGYKSSPWTDGYGYGAWSAPTLFQYTGTGRLSGYGGNLDLDKFYGNEVTWRSLAARS